MLELKYSKLQESLSETSSNRVKQLNIIEFVDYILTKQNSGLAEAYLTELIPVYISLIKSIKIRGLNPEILKILLNQINQVNEFEFANPFRTELNEALTIVRNKFDLMTSWINGTGSYDHKNLIYFPVIERYSAGNPVGFLETVAVNITEGEDKFIIEPIESENDFQLQDQLHLCWNNALNYCRKYLKKIKPSHTVELKFENRLGLYVGDSLGIALTLAFIEAILKHYNASVIIKTNGIAAMSGGIDRNNNIIAIGKTNIETKVDTVFYSDAKFFCIPKADEIFATEKLNLLNEKFPDRFLRIIGLTDFEDLLSRRNVIEIKKFNRLERLSRYILSKWESILFATLLTAFLLFMFAIDFDDNPAMFEQNGKLLSVQNKNGKELWTVMMNFNANTGTEDRSASSRKVVDINNDGINEVLISEEELSVKKFDQGRVVCFDKDKNMIWEYHFRDTISTFRKWTDNYQIGIVDTATINGVSVLFLKARNIPHFANAIFKIDLKTGKRFDSTSTLWNAGAITNVMLGDFNEDGRKEMIVTGNHNGFERALLFSVDIDKMKGQTPAPDRYVFQNIPLAELNRFILLPHSDYGKYFHRTNVVQVNGLYYTPTSKEFVVITNEGIEKPISFNYGFDNHLNYLWVDCGDNAQIMRDSLVTKGILSPPLTNTDEYFEILKNETISR
ncbi:MAG: hypothetical protein R6W68_05945 [Ignavibacteriaceae bacterium]